MIFRHFAQNACEVPFSCKEVVFRQNLCYTENGAGFQFTEEGREEYVNGKARLCWEKALIPD